ncbi:DUF4064 domain-containing protein [Thalassorhabdus alkalitolerans]|uniref:DUF4064 domain-containing protein n=1 Tax=Thalassorhabdus alkalitolerans TaxID=2282697 RepID=A0ABW0YL61_9BACI|nr:DUF4064 domain-containing protein [Bacillus sp. FJAT-44742]
MKRTGEVTLGIIGVVLSGLVSILGFTLTTFMDSQEFQQQLSQEMAQDPAMGTEEVNMVIGMLGTFGWAIIISSILGAVLGIIAVINIRGGKRRILAGILFLITAVIVGIGTLGFAFVPAILFLIAGIMALVRKPKPPENEPVY